LGRGYTVPATGQPLPDMISSFAFQHHLPTASTRSSDFNVLMYYGPELDPLFRRAASFHADRILRGAKPADIPFEGPTVFEVIVNRSTAIKLGIAIPPEFAAQVTMWID